MEMIAYLSQFRVDAPAWLQAFKPGDGFDREAFLRSPLVYYPGSGFDGHAVQLFSSAHAAHCFVYVDYGIPADKLVESMQHPRYGFRGYTSIAHMPLTQAQLAPHGWLPHVDITPQRRMMFATQNYAFVEVLQRMPNFSDEHGPPRLAILFIGGDGIASYDALFCQRTSWGTPKAVLIQDHGFGGNYDRFGKGGLLEQIALRAQVLPEFLIATSAQTAWQGFSAVADVECSIGGQHRNQRFIYKNIVSRTGVSHVQS